MFNQQCDTQKSSSNVRVNVGIDEELRMILELDPEIIDLGSSLTKPVNILCGFPPFSAGLVLVDDKIILQMSCILKDLLFFVFSPPNLKTATPCSRTQLKQQLMREQALQEQERRQAQERAQKMQEQQQRPPPPTPVAMRVPLHSIAVDVPPQVLQVCYFIQIAFACHTHMFNYRCKRNLKIQQDITLCKNKKVK